MDKETKVRENRLRAAAKRQGLILQKSRRRDPNALEYGGYMLSDMYKNTVVFGVDAFAFNADLDQIEEFLKGE